MAPHNLGVLIDRQMRRWDLQRVVTVTEAFSPCITISRLPYAGAGELGRKAAEWLDYGFFDRELVEQIARERHVQSQLVTGLDEQVRSAIERYVTDAFRTRSFTESDYLRDLVRLVATLANRGMAVLVGRGAPFLVPADRGLRVLVVASRTLRAARLAQAEGIDDERAAGRLAELEERRREFHRVQLGVDYEDPLHYDLVVNTGSLGIEPAARLVVEALRGRFPTI